MAIPNGAGGTQHGDGNIGEATIYNQGNPATYAAAATLTAADLATGVINYTGGSANLTLPLVSDLELLVTVAKSNYAFANSIIASGAGTVNILTNTGWTIVGSIVIVSGASGRFGYRKTAPGAWTLYRLS